MIKLLADENFPLASVELLETKKYNIINVSKDHSGISDRNIIQLANQEDRLILTFDRDFGHLIFKEGVIPKMGIIFFRLQQFHPLLPAQVVIDLLQNNNFETVGAITVIEDNFIRQKKF
jgi:predicted nuclease of predicted toxin-antitoxin system